VIFAAGSCGAYLGGGFGFWELAYPLLATPVVYAGLRSYPFIGIAWLMHAAWDMAHHLWGNPIWPFMPTSSWGCMIFDSLIAIWFLAGAPALIPNRAIPAAPHPKRGQARIAGSRTGPLGRIWRES
jgi:hypothetical protein